MTQDKSDVVRRFELAVSEGYQYAIKNPEDAANTLIKNAPEADPQLIKKSQAWLSPQYQADASQWGVQKASVLPYPTKTTYLSPCFPECAKKRKPDIELNDYDNNGLLKEK